MSRPAPAPAQPPGTGSAPPAWDPFGQQAPAQQPDPDPFDLHQPTQRASSYAGQGAPQQPEPQPQAPNLFDQYPQTEMSRPGSGPQSQGPDSAPPDPYASQGGYPPWGQPAAPSAPQAAPYSPPASPYAPPDQSGRPNWGTPAAPQPPFDQQAAFDPQYQSGAAQSSGYPAPGAPTAPWTPAAGQSWSAVVSADRGYYDNVRRVSGSAAQGIDFPPYAAERRFTLAGAQMRIGRHSASRGLYPEIDLTGPPTDPGISRLHAVLIARPDGGWAVLDPGSANGTMLNGSEIPVNQQVPLRNGDRINMGAWTAITVQQA
jgi:hypothetical protein